MTVPDEELTPPYWTLLTSTDDSLEFTRRVETDIQRFRVRLDAHRSSRTSPPRSGAVGWKIEFGKQLNNEMWRKTVGHAGCRSEAIRSMFGAMRRINGAVDREDGGEIIHAELITEL